MALAKASAIAIGGPGEELTILGFTSTYGKWISIFTAVAMCCFAFSTIIGWGLVWSISDTCNVLMVIPNLIGVFQRYKILTIYYSHYNTLRVIAEALAKQHHTTLGSAVIIAGNF